MNLEFIRVHTEGMIRGKFFVLSLLIILCSLFITSCPNPWMKEILGVSEITFNANGGSPTPEKQFPWKDELIKQPNNPVKAEYNFAGWYTDNNTFENLWDFNVYPNNTDMTLFAKWDPIIVIPISGITILTDPTKMDYIYGEPLNLSGLTVKVDYEDGSEQIFSFAQFTSNGLTAAPVNGAILLVPTHNGTAINVSGGGFSSTTAGTLTITPRQLTINAPTGNPAKVYDGTTAHTGLTAGTLTNVVPGDVINPSITSATYNSADAATANQITIVYGITGAAAANYIAPVNGTIAGTITKASGAAVSGAPTVNGIPTENSITVNPVTILTTPVNTGQTVVQYAISTLDNADASSLTWGTSTIFNGLNANTTYYVYARSEETANYNAGNMQRSAAIKTAASQNTDGLMFDLIIVDGSPVLNPPASELIIYRSSANGVTTFSSINIILGASYLSQRWYVDGDQLGTGVSFILDSSDIRYNDIGMHTLAVFITNASGTYNTTIWFEVRE